MTPWKKEHRLKPIGPGCLPIKTHTHFELGFSVNASTTLGRKVRERKGAWVRALERFNIVVTKAAAIKSAAQLLGTNVYGVEIVKNHENKQGQLDSLFNR